MTGAKGIIRRFRPLGKARDSVLLAQCPKPFPTTGQNFMGIRLVAHIPYHGILGSVKNAVQGQGQIHGSQAGSQMAARLRYGFYHQSPKLHCQLFQLGYRKSLELSGIFYLF